MDLSFGELAGGALAAASWLGTVLVKHRGGQFLASAKAALLEDREAYEALRHTVEVSRQALKDDKLTREELDAVTASLEKAVKELGEGMKATHGLVESGIRLWKKVG